MYRNARPDVAGNLRSYLEYLCNVQRPTSQVNITQLNLPVYILDVPKQNNGTDCGVFLLQYVEQFFIKDPLRSFNFPMKPLNNWFDQGVIEMKRKAISLLIKKCMIREGKDISGLPKLSFSKSGVIKQKDMIISHDDEVMAVDDDTAPQATSSRHLNGK
jgi:hypothetical protein